MKRGNIVISMFISGLYIVMGTYNYFSHGKISHYFYDLKADLDNIIVWPSEIFGVIMRFAGGFIYDSDLFFVLGQFVGLVIYTCLIWLLIKTVELICRKIKG